MDPLETNHKKTATVLDILSEPIWVAGADKKEFAQQTTKFCRMALEAQMVMLWECDYSSIPPILLLLSYHGDHEGNFNVAINNDEEILGRCIVRGEFVQINDLQDIEEVKERATINDKLHQDIVKIYGCRSAMIAPIDLGGQIQGAIASYAEKPQAFSKIDERIINSFAQRYAAFYMGINYGKEESENILARMAPYIESEISVMERIHDASNDLGIAQSYISQVFAVAKQKSQYNLMEYSKAASVSIDSVMKLFKTVRNRANLNAVRLRKYNLIDTLKQIINQFDVIAKEYKIIFELKYPINVEFFYDQSQIARVFQILINNSIYFLSMVSRKGKKIRITVSIEKKTINVCFWDNGPGINSYDIKKVFNYLFSTKSKGMGFGLAIAKKIIEENHKGSISVKSRWGYETEFSIILPYIKKNEGNL